MARIKMHGILIGQAVGDALGFPVEGQNFHRCNSYVDNLSKHQQIPNRIGMQSGQYTDDTQLARELLISIRDNNGFDPRNYAKRIANIFETNLIIGRGMATQNAAFRLIQGATWDSAGEPSPSAGNGTAMRSGVIAIVSDNIDEIKSIAKQSSIITHRDNRCVAGSIIIALGCQKLSLTQTIDVNNFIQYLVDVISSTSTLFASELAKLVNIIDHDFKDAVQIISNLGKPDMKTSRWNFISPYVIPSVLWSIYSFCKSPDSYTEAIKTAIRGGGDVDTTAAMTGALSGSYLGMNAIPEIWLSSITDQGNWDYTDLIDLVNDIMEIKENGLMDHQILSSS